MSVNLMQALRFGADSLHNYSDTAHLDAEVLLSYVIHKNKSYLYAHSEDEITADQYKYYQELIKRRQKKEPIAYIVGHKEFWSLDLIVTPEVLIPRPETEILVELTLKNFAKKQMIRVADLGLGSGAVAIALAFECPNWEVYGTEISEAALTVALQNAEKFKLKNIHFLQSEWCAALPKDTFDVIVSNPPYISANEDLLRDLKYEPYDALVSGPSGLEALQEIIPQAKEYLITGGLLFVEHGDDQEKQVAELFKQENYSAIKNFKDIAGKPRVTQGQKW
jgi:release factor glutamine methyltransferase